MPRLQALIFDLDGTLVDSAPDLRQALNTMLAKHGRPNLPLDDVKFMVGDGALPLITRAFTSTGGLPENFDPAEHFKIFIESYRSLPADFAQIYPHVRETLESFFRKDVKLGLCTNKQEAATVRLMEDLDLDHFFSFIAGGDTFPVHKPHPGHVKGVIEHMGVAPTQSVMIGDSSNDVLSAHGAGVACIGVTHGYGQNMEKIGADLLIGGFGELSGALNQLGFEF